MSQHTRTGHCQHKIYSDKKDSNSIQYVYIHSIQKLRAPFTPNKLINLKDDHRCSDVCESSVKVLQLQHSSQVRGSEEYMKNQHTTLTASTPQEQQMVIYKDILTKHLNLNNSQIHKHHQRVSSDHPTLPEAAWRLWQWYNAEMCDDSLLQACDNGW